MAEQDPSRGTPKEAETEITLDSDTLAEVQRGKFQKPAFFGDMSSYHVRQVGGVEIARSDDAFFTTDLVAFRVSLRLDADLGQADAVKTFIGNAS